MSKGNLSLFFKYGVQEERYGGAKRKPTQSLIHNTFKKFNNDHLS